MSAKEQFRRWALQVLKDAGADEFDLALFSQWSGLAYLLLTRR